MKSVGEAMAIGRSFVEALQKAMRSLEQTPSQFWLEPDPEGTAEDALELRAHVRTTCGCSPSSGRCASARRPQQVFDATGIDPWFVDQLLSPGRAARRSSRHAPDLDADLLRLAKRHGLQRQADRARSAG